MSGKRLPRKALTRELADPDVKPRRDSERQADQLIARVFGAIEKLVEAGQPVVVPGFGRFEVRQRAARRGRLGGVEIEIPARRQIAFKDQRS